MLRNTSPRLRSLFWCSSRPSESSRMASARLITTMKSLLRSRLEFFSALFSLAAYPRSPQRLWTAVQPSDRFSTDHRTRSSWWFYLLDIRLTTARFQIWPENLSTRSWKFIKSLLRRQLCTILIEFRDSQELAPTSWKTLSCQKLPSPLEKLMNFELNVWCEIKSSSSCFNCSVLASLLIALSLQRFIENYTYQLLLMLVMMMT